MSNRIAQCFQLEERNEDSKPTATITFDWWMFEGKPEYGVVHHHMDRHVWREEMIDNPNDWLSSIGVILEAIFQGGYDEFHKDGWSRFTFRNHRYDIPIDEIWVEPFTHAAGLALYMRERFAS